MSSGRICTSQSRMVSYNKFHFRDQANILQTVKAVNDLLLKKNKENGWDIHIHVDGASGGFYSPWVTPEVEFDFRLPLVASMNVSGHKYGLSYAGVGFAIFRSKEYLPQEILFTVNYLGSDQISFTLNFSKSAVQVIGQYYQFCQYFADLLSDSRNPAASETWQEWLSQDHAQLDRHCKLHCRRD